ncbi:hypothetical protein [Fructobacillus fructosus]|uniref:hypothetical protein n=1 Tax=Fructobacillus fructosus TaxID=1631 RepID=UPI002D949632|nr:unnamed protein product [Fructobacillus fructosus]CAK1250993.1 unnamed protein product [Fructobacillus fructosus]CAK1252662.1 unnamed protein product [Fructobacillus fructosus]
MNKFIVYFNMPLSGADEKSIESRGLLEDLVGHGNWLQLTGELIAIKTKMSLKDFSHKFLEMDPPYEFFVIDANDFTSSSHSDYKHDLFNNL